ncbi:hypothetical protein PoB_000350200 [Plakobranchus ocellatus]|uniref:Uncharacterized protein n=1 Tax=Plakobranchus ocellatus TaxID=259542 RepID=A0AAV3Y2S4_9GAST|nr:hypothetical protein PoB_000350200 [Plakobranchus ocellatus]
MYSLTATLMLRRSSETGPLHVAARPLIPLHPHTDEKLTGINTDVNLYTAHTYKNELHSVDKTVPSFSFTCS